MGSKVKKYSVLFCVGIVACCFMGFILRIVVQKSFEGKKISEAPFRAVFMDKDENFFMKVKNRMDKKQETKELDIDWVAMYPFRQEGFENQGAKLEGDKKSRLELFIGRVNERKGKMKNKLETHLENYLIGYNQMVDSSRKYEEKLGKKLEYLPINEVYRLPDGFFTFVYDKWDVKDKVECVKTFRDYCKDKKINFAFICAPFKVCENDAGFYGVKDFSNQNADNFLKGLEENDILYMDLRAKIKEQGLDHHSLFFRTDHHWLPEAGLWGAREVSKFINKEFAYKMDTDKLVKDNFDVVKYEKWFLGSQGCKVKLQFADPDDIELFYTKEPVSLALQVPHKGLDAEGDFSIMYEMDEIEPLDYYGSDPYSAYGHGDVPLIRVHNKGNVPNKKVLMVKDSFAGVLYPFFCLGVSDMTVVDLRYFTGSLLTLVESEKPDTVLILYNPHELGGEIDYGSHKSLWDFR